MRREIARKYVDVSAAAGRFVSFLDVFWNLLTRQTFIAMILHGDTFDLGAVCFRRDGGSNENGETNVEQRHQADFCTSQRVLVRYLYLQAIEIANRS